MRVLVASPFLPWPLNTGGNAAQYSTLQCLARDHDFTLVAPYYRAEQAAHVHELAKRLPRVHVRGVFCGDRSPKSHVLTLHRQSVDACSQVQNAVDNPRLGSSSLWEDAVLWLRRKARRLLHRRLTLVEDSPHYPFRPLPAAFISALHEEIQHGTDLIQVEFVEMLPLGAWLPLSIPRLFIHHQVHSVYADRFVATQGVSPYTSYLSSWMAAQEKAYLRNYDAVITFSEEDRLVLSSWPGLNRVFTSPFPIPADVGVAPELPDRFSGRFIFLGAEVHDVNRQALRWLLQTIWPEIVRQRPGSRLEIIGRWSTTWKTIFRPEGAHYMGFLPDLRGAMRGGIMLVPLQIGSGIRTKILAALAQGVPVVTTRMGAEGLLVRDGVDLIVRDDPVAFAQAAVELAESPERWRAVSESGQREVMTHYSPDQVRRRRNQIYEAIVQRRESAVQEHMLRFQA